MEFERPKVGVGVLVVRDGKFLLGKRKGKHMSGLYAQPGGHIEYGETFAECAKREVLEETGLVVTNVSFLAVGNYLLDGKHYVDVAMTAEAPAGIAQVMEPDKVESWDWYSIEELPLPLFVITKNVIDVYINGFDPAKAMVNQLDRQDSLVELLQP